MIGVFEQHKKAILFADGFFLLVGTGEGECLWLGDAN